MNKEANNELSWKQAAFLIFVFFTLFPLIHLPQFYVFKLYNPGRSGVPWDEILGRIFLDSYLWALLTPLIFFVGRRFPVERPFLIRNFVLLMFFNFLLASFQTAMWWYLWEGLVMGKSFEAKHLGPYLNKNTYSIILCASISIFCQAIEYARKYRDREFRLQQAELQSLKMQLHPHFLFNTLNAISALNIRNPEIANRTIAQLSDLLRISLKGGRSQEIILKEELDFLRKYVQIQQTLLQERLKVEWKIDPYTLDALVPNMILQPLVENSIQHGISNLENGGQIEIISQRQNGTLLLEVRDNGKGFPNTGVSTKSGIGLPNTKARLKHLYGEAHKFSFQNLPEGGAEVSVGIPFKERSQEN